MKRRKLIKFGLLTGTGVAVSTLIPGCKGELLEIDLETYTPKLFTENQYQFLQSYANVLLPSSDTPGAASTGLVQIMDRIEHAISDKESHQNLMTKVQMLSDYFNHQHEEQKWSDLDGEKQEAFVASMDTKLTSGDAEVSKVYKEIKQKLVHYFLNTEEVGTELLNFLPVPGEYQACVSLDETGNKAWTI